MASRRHFYRLQVSAGLSHEKVPCVVPALNTVAADTCGSMVASCDGRLPGNMYVAPPVDNWSYMCHRL